MFTLKCPHGGYRTVYKTKFCPSTKWVPGFEFRWKACQHATLPAYVAVFDDPRMTQFSLKSDTCHIYDSDQHVCDNFMLSHLLLLILSRLPFIIYLYFKGLCSEDAKCFILSVINYSGERPRVWLCKIFIRK